MTPSEPIFFDPSFERLPAPVAGEQASGGPVLVLVHPDADRAWAADAGVALATGWHAAGRRTFLADLSLEDPYLHERLGMPNQEGVVDIFVYGASMARSARPVPGRGFYLISAGTYTPDAGAVLRNPRWEKIVSTFRENDAALLLFAPADAPEVAALSEWVAAAIVLGGEALPAAAERFLTRAWLAPPRAAGAATPPERPAQPAGRFPEPAAGAPWTAPPGTREAAAAPAAAEEIPVPDAAWSEEEAPPAPRRRAVSPLLLVLLLLALAAAALVLLPRYVSGFPDLLGLAGRDAERTEAPAPAPRAERPTGPVEPAGEALPYSIQVANYQRREEAVQEASDVARRFPEAQFFVVPENVQGMTWWRVMAGMGEDTTALLDLRDRLIAAEVVDEEAFGGRFNIIQHRPFAYQVGEYADAGAARARADSLSTRSIPAYVAPVPFSDGTERWRVYAGAYRDSANAAPMRDLLRGATLEPELVERTGRPPAAPK